MVRFRTRPIIKEILEATNHAFGVTSELKQATGDIARFQEQVKEQSEEIRSLTALVERLAFDIELLKQRADAEQKQAQTERENLVLQLKIAMLESERRLPPAPQGSA